MANKRMFNIEIIDADNFLDMPVSSQNLYFHLALRADDDGFVANPKKIQRIIGASDDDANILIFKNYLIKFENGLIVIKHWRIHNYLRSDRYKPSINTFERELLIVEKNGEYSLNRDGVPSGIPLVCLDKTSKDKTSKDKTSKDKTNSKNGNGNDFYEFRDFCIKNYEKVNFTLPYPFEDLRKNTMVKITASGFLQNASIDKLFDKDKAFKVWNYMYSKKDKLFEIIESSNHE